MGLKELLAKSAAAAPKKRARGDDEERLQWIDMSMRGYDTVKDGVATHVPANRGTIKFFPIQDVTGRDVIYPYDVWNYRYETEPDDNGNTRIVNVHYMDPKDYQMDLTDEQKAKILKVRSKIEYFADHINGFPDAVNKNYALIFGYVLEHISNEDQTVITGKENRHAALLIFPSKNFARAMTACLNSMNQMGEQMANEMYNDLFSRNEERSVYLEVSFDTGSGFGYECNIQAKPIDRFAMNILSPEELKELKVKIPKEQIDLCQSLSATYFAGGFNGNDDFDEDLCNKVIKQIDGIVASVEVEKNAAENLPPLPNKNKKKKSDLDEDKSEKKDVKS